MIAEPPVFDLASVDCSKPVAGIEEIRAGRMVVVNGRTVTPASGCGA